MSEKHLEHELKKEFQLERIILFSDAVFAIAITLLVLELKVPEIQKQTVTDAVLLDSLDHLIPKFIGFIVSFMIVGLYWTVHHRMFGHVINYTRRTLWLNLWFLFAVILMPFSTAFYSEYIVLLLKTPLIIYVCNICLLGIMNFVLWRHLTKASLHLTEGVDEYDKKYFSLRAITIPAIFIITAFIYFFNPIVAVYIPISIPIIMTLIRKFYLRKDKSEIPKQEKPENQ